MHSSSVRFEHTFSFCVYIMFIFCSTHAPSVTHTWYFVWFLLRPGSPWSTWLKYSFILGVETFVQLLSSFPDSQGADRERLLESVEQILRDVVYLEPILPDGRSIVSTVNGVGWWRVWEKSVKLCAVYKNFNPSKVRGKATMRSVEGAIGFSPWTRLYTNGNG